MSTSTLQIPETISENAQVAFDSEVVNRLLPELRESERTVVQLAFWDGLSVEKIAMKLGRTTYWVDVRYRSALEKLREKMHIEVKAAGSPITPAMAVGMYQHEHSLKSAILAKFHEGDLNRKEIGELLCQLNDILATKGRNGLMRAFLREHDIPRGFAQYCMGLARPQPETEEDGNEEANWIESNPFSPEATEVRKKKLLRVVNKFYDLHSGISNKTQILADFDALTAQVRAQIEAL